MSYKQNTRTKSDDISENRKEKLALQYISFCVYVGLEIENVGINKADSSSINFEEAERVKSMTIYQNLIKILKRAQFCTLYNFTFLSYSSHFFMLHRYFRGKIRQIENYSSAKVRYFHCTVKKKIRQIVSINWTWTSKLFSRKKIVKQHIMLICCNSTFFESRSSFSRKIRQIDYSSFSVSLFSRKIRQVADYSVIDSATDRSECNLTNFSSNDKWCTILCTLFSKLLLNVLNNQHAFLCFKRWFKA